MSGPLDFLALQKSVNGLQSDVVKLLEGGDATLDRIEQFVELVRIVDSRHSELTKLVTTVPPLLIQVEERVEERFDALNSQTEERFNLVLKGSEATLDRLESLENKIEHSDVTVNAALSQVVSGLGERLADVERDLDSRVDSGSVRLDKLEELDHEATDARVDVNRRLDLIEADVIDRAEETHRRITALLNSQATKTETLKSQVQVLTDRVAASNSQWGELYDRVGRFEGTVEELIPSLAVKLGAQLESRIELQGLAMDELGVVAVNLLEASKALQKRIDDLEESNLIAVAVAERHGDSIVLLEKLRRRDAGL